MEMKLYESICEIKPYDSEKVTKLKKEMKKFYIQQEKMEDKYKCVRDYAELGYKINRIKSLIEEVEEY